MYSTNHWSKRTKLARMSAKLDDPKATAKNIGLFYTEL